MKEDMKKIFLRTFGCQMDAVTRDDFKNIWNKITGYE